MRRRLVAAGIALACTGTAVAAANPTVAGASGLTFTPATTTSSDWAGWDVTGGSYTSVSAKWTQPTATCSTASDADSAFWVGLDGDTSTSVEQTGTEANCVNGVAQYRAFYEFYPAPSVELTRVVKPGDKMSASVTYSRTTGRYTLTLEDLTRGWTSTERETVASGTNASAEVIAEAPTDARTGAVTALADFGTARFTAVTVNGRKIGTVATPKKIAMADSFGTALATASALSTGSTFAVTWKSAGTSEAEAGTGAIPGGTAPGGQGSGSSGWPDGSGGSGGYGWPSGAAAGSGGSGGYAWPGGSSWAGDGYGYGCGSGDGYGYGDGYGFGYGQAW